MGGKLSQMVLKKLVGVQWGSSADGRVCYIGGPFVVINAYLMMYQMQRQNCLLRDVYTLVFLSFQTL